MVMSTFLAVAAFVLLAVVKIAFSILTMNMAILILFLLGGFVFVGVWQHLLFLEVMKHRDTGSYENAMSQTVVLPLHAIRAYRIVIDFTQSRVEAGNCDLLYISTNKCDGMQFFDDAQSLVTAANSMPSAKLYMIFLNTVCILKSISMSTNGTPYVIVAMEEPLGVKLPGNFSTSGSASACALSGAHGTDVGCTLTWIYIA